MSEPRRAGSSPARHRWTASAAASVLAAVLSGCSTGVVAGPTTEPSMGPSYSAVPAVFGRPLYRSTDSQTLKWAKQNRAAWLAPITDRPVARWVNGPADVASLGAARKAADRAGQQVVFVVYDITDRGCDHGKQGAATPKAYLDFVRSIATTMHGSGAAAIVEPDAIPADCYDAARGALLKQAVTLLTQAGVFAYLDAGHAAWRTSGLLAERLVASGITVAAGFSINVSARGTTADSRRFGDELSNLVGDRPYVIDTSRNGAGPSVDAQGQQIWCNAPDQGLGEPPDVRPVGANVARLWIKAPGESDGNWAGCGDETAYPGLFSPRQARHLISNAPWVTAAQKKLLPTEKSLPWTR